MDAMSRVEPWMSDDARRTRIDTFGRSLSDIRCRTCLVMTSRPPVGKHGLDALLRRHLAMLLVSVQTGDDPDVARLARSETRRLIGAVTVSLRSHALDAVGTCTKCGAKECSLRNEISLALLPARPRFPVDSGWSERSPYSCSPEVPRADRPTGCWCLL
ncbi:hypothetical protein [Umezawaea beigongshangensis]|uniref:hypothetical protein n=1 Tax=Umezawaea beigongshangensis TaxID=2780383 RepID=UPI0018F1ED73|nr:hypothetical protein [Umezawaea beigongshangensis]